MVRWRQASGEGVLGPLEREVMAVLWNGGDPMSVREVVSCLNETRDEPLAYTTVMTTLARLADKGMLRRQREGRRYRYEAAVRDPAEAAVRNVVRQFGDAALAHFVDEVRADPQLRRRLQGLLGEQHR